MFDGYFTNDALPNLHKEMILWYEISELFQKYNIRKDIDILSLDTDYADFWILESILKEYSPKVIVHEVNQQPPDICVTVPRSYDLKLWDGTEFQGASICAYYCLAKLFDYSMIYCENAGINCFWVRNDLIKKHLKVDATLVQDILNPKYLYRKSKFSYKITSNKWEQFSC